jgi:hypothetical protein
MWWSMAFKLWSCEIMGKSWVIMDGIVKLLAISVVCLRMQKKKIGPSSQKKIYNKKRDVGFLFI